MSRAGNLCESRISIWNSKLKKKGGGNHLINVYKMVFPCYMSRVGGDLYIKSILTTIIPVEEIAQSKSADAHSNRISCYRVYCILLSQNLVQLYK